MIFGLLKRKEKVNKMDAFEEFGEDLLNSLSNDVNDWDDETLKHFCRVMKRYNMFEIFKTPQAIVDSYHAYE